MDTNLESSNDEFVVKKTCLDTKMSTVKGQIWS